MKIKILYLMIILPLFFGMVIPITANASSIDKLRSTLILSTDPPDAAVDLKVQPNTMYTYTLTLKNNLASQSPIVIISPRLPSSFTLINPVVCPQNWEEIQTPNSGRDVGIINCVENGLDTSIPNPTSNTKYDIAYGKKDKLSFSFVTPSATGTTDLSLGIGYIDNSGLLRAVHFSPVHLIIVE